MHKMLNKIFKFHKQKSAHLFFTGTILLVVATVLMLNVFEVFNTESKAEGYVTVENGNNKGTFWYGYTIPHDLKLWQELKVTTTYNLSNYNKDYTYGSDYSNDYASNTISLPYSRKGTFRLNINSQKLMSNNSGLGDDARSVNTSVIWKDSSNADCYFDWISSGATNYTTTYYRVLKKNESVGTDWGVKLMDYYNSSYTPSSGKKSSDDIVQTYDSVGRNFRDMANTFMTNKGFSVYSNNSEIPLVQNGETIAGIEMLTVMSRDFYYDVVRGSESSKRVDLDIMLYTSHNYKFNFTSSREILKQPVVTTESGNGVENIMTADDLVLMSVDNNPANSSVAQYYLTDSDNLDTANIKWESYSGPFSTAGKKYLYVRSNYKDGNLHYYESEAKKYTLTYMESSSAVVHSTPQNGASVDVGEKITLSQYGAADPQPALFYTIDADSTPTLERVTYDKCKELNLDNEAQGEDYVSLNGTVYIKINGIWYKCSDASVKKYKNSITTDEQLRVKNAMTIHVLVGDDGKEVGGFHPLTFSYTASEQTAAPESTVPTTAGTPATVEMGSTIGLMCSTSGSRIFYTTNGSAPIINVTASDGPTPGANTKEYTDDDPIVVNEEIAAYGKSFLIMAQAVTYTQYEGNYYRTCQDSPVVKFNYKVGEQTPVEAVQSIPKSNTETPVEVSIGSKIQLYSDTAGVDIYYTIDGSEPQFDETTKEPKGNTKKYVPATGVIVEKATDSSLFTITAVAYKEGLATSNISRLVFAYPGAVSSPYATPASGAVMENTAVTLNTATEGAVIYYEVATGANTPNEPTTSSKVFDATNPIKITQKTTIKAYAVKNSMESAVSTFTYTVSTKLSTPKPSIETGAVVASGTVVSLEADSGATIYYTTDGSNPKDSENKKVQVGSSVVLNGKAGDMVVLRTYAAKTGYSSSDEGSYSYSISAYTGGIYADRESGETLKNGSTIHLHTDMSNASIYYTTDGSTPTQNSKQGSQVTLYGEPGETVTLMAMAVTEGGEKTTSFATFTYTIMQKLASPTSSVPDGAIFTKESVVELKAETGKIYYTTDGSDPSTSSILYKKSIVIDGEVTIKAIAVAEDLEQSDVSSYSYGFAQQVAAPIASYASGELEMGTKVTFTCETEGATIYYRTDGGELDLSRKSELEIYKEPITMNQAMNFKVIAVKDKMQDSKVLNVGYTVREPIVIETVEEETSQELGGQGNRLQSRRSFSDTDSGPSYTDVVLKNASYGAIVAAEEGVLPDTVQLKVEPTNVTDAVERRVKQVVNESFGIVASYDVTLLVNGEEAQPEGTIEIGLPIPVEYENAMIYIVHVQEDGNIELFETRRSGGVAYAKVEHLSVYSITAPVEFDEEESKFPWLPVMYTMAVGLTGCGVWLIYKSKKEKREDGTQDV